MKRLIMVLLYFLVFLKQLVGCKKKTVKVRVLILHDVGEDQLHKLESIVSHLSKKWSFLTPSQFEAYISGDLTLDSDSLLFSFDDGFKSSFQAHTKVLKPRGIKSIFFIATGFVGLGAVESRNYCKTQLMIPDSSIKDQHSPLEWSEINSLLQEGCAVGSHTNSHFAINKLKHESLVEDLRISNELISSKTVVSPVLSFAFPFGNIDSVCENSLDVCKSFYKYIYTGFRGNNSPGCFQIYRDALNLDDPLFYTDVYLSGIVDVYYR